MHLDTVCTMVDRDAVVMYPALRTRLWRTPCVGGGGGVSRPGAVPGGGRRGHGHRRLRVIDTGLDPVTAEREQWDDGNNTLALAPGVVVAYERNVRPTPG